MQDVFEADMQADQRLYPLYERVYLALAATFVVVLVLTNVIGIKLFQPDRRAEARRARTNDHNVIFHGFAFNFAHLAHILRLAFGGHISRRGSHSLNRVHYGL